MKKTFSIIFVIGGRLTNVFIDAADKREVFKELFKLHGPLYNSEMSEDEFILWCRRWCEEPTKDQGIYVQEVIV